jgi:hypothetical protein
MSQGNDDDAHNAIRVHTAEALNRFFRAKGYPDLAGTKAPLAAVQTKGCSTHGIQYSCSKCGWNHCTWCGSSEVANAHNGVSGWAGLCHNCLASSAGLSQGPAPLSPTPQDDGPLADLGTGRLDPGSAEYAHISQSIRASLATGNAFYEHAPFQAHGLPIRMRCSIRIHEIVRHTSKHMVNRFAKAAAEMQELRVARQFDHGLPPMEEYPVFVGCCRDEARRIEMRGFCPSYAEAHGHALDGVVFGSKYFQFAMTQADQGAAALRIRHPVITPIRRYVCVARALTGRLEQIDTATDRRVSAAADTGCDAEWPWGWVRAFFDVERLKLEYVVVYDLVAAGGAGSQADDVIDVEWGSDAA